MTLRFYFDTAVLGPTYEPGFRHLVLSISSAWEAQAPPPDWQSRALLKPWRWRCDGFSLYRQDAAGALHPLIDPAQAPLDPSWEPPVVPSTQGSVVSLAIANLEALYSRCEVAGGQDVHHRFSLALLQNHEAEQDPDFPNRQCWPDLLADAGRWPGLLPHRLGLQVVLKVAATEINAVDAYVVLPRVIAVEDAAVPGATAALVARVPQPVPDSGQPGDASVYYDWQNGAAPVVAPVAAVAELSGGKAPSESPENGSLLDMATLWIRQTPSTSHDWFAAVPAFLADTFDQPSLLFDVLEELRAGSEQIKQALERSFSDEKQAKLLLIFAVSHWQDRYGDMRRISSDGDHPLLAILNVVLGDDYRGDIWKQRLSTAGHTLGADLVSSPETAMQAIDRHLRLAVESVDIGTQRLLPFQGGTGDGLDRRTGQALLLEAARTLAWMSSDAGLFDLYGPRWLTWMASLPEDTGAERQRLQAWLRSDARDAYPLGIRIREDWVRNGGAVSPLATTVAHLHAQLTTHQLSEVEDGKAVLVHALDNLDQPLLANESTVAYLRLGILSDAVLGPPVRAAWAARIGALAVRHLDGNARDARTIPGYPAQYGDPWPVDRVQNLLYAIDRPGDVTSDDSAFEDLRRQIAGIGLLLRQADRRWKCLAAAHMELIHAGKKARYPALYGEPATFAGGMRSTLLTYTGEPWFDRPPPEQLSEQYRGMPDNDSELVALQAWAHSEVRIPELKFGQQYAGVPFIIGPGNALPQELSQGHPARASELLFADGLEAALPPDPGLMVYYLRRVPIGAPLITPSNGSSLFSRTPDIKPLAHEVLVVDSDATKEPLALLCPVAEAGWLDSADRVFQIQPPEVDMQVWLRHWRAMLMHPHADRNWRPQLDEGLARWMQYVADKAPSDRDMPTIRYSDPGHDAYLIQVEVVWSPPRQRPPQTLARRVLVLAEGAAQSPLAATPEVVLRLRGEGTLLEIIEEAGSLTIRGLTSGCVYRIGVSALARAERFAPLPANGIVGPVCVFAPAALFSEVPDMLEHAGVNYVAFAARTLLAEVACTDLPDSAALAQALQPAFDGRVLSVAADFAAHPDANWEFIRTLTLERQRWQWAGRHADPSTILSLVPTGMGAPGFVPSGAPAFEDWAFAGRPVGDHVREYADCTAAQPRTVVFREDLQSQSIAFYERYRLRAATRYAGLRQCPDLEEVGMTDWQPYAVKMRDTRAPATPKLAMVLPLTGGMSVCPAQLHRMACLLQLDEAAFAQGGLPECIDVEVVVAGPDPILPVRSVPPLAPLICEVFGPLGHSFDPDIAGARFRRASFVVAFDQADGGATRTQTWSMVQLRVRRRIPEAWVWPPCNHDLKSEWIAAGWIQLPRPSDQILLQGGTTVSADQLQLRRIGSGIEIAHKQGAVGGLALDIEPEFPDMFAILTCRALDARGIPGAEQIMHEQRVTPGMAKIDFTVPASTRRGSLRLRLVSVQRDPREEKTSTCQRLADLFRRQGDMETADACFRLMRVSDPVIEIAAE